jgi:hypothetical protein
MKFCTSCGTKNWDSAKFCTTCGAKSEAPLENIVPLPEDRAPARAERAVIKVSPGHALPRSIDRLGEPFATAALTFDNGVPSGMASAKTPAPVSTAFPPVLPPAVQSEKARIKYHCPDCNGSVELTETPRVGKIMDWLNNRPVIYFLFGLMPLLFVLIVLLLVHAVYGYWCINCGRVSFLKLPLMPKIYTFIIRCLASILVGFVLRMIIAMLCV